MEIDKLLQIEKTETLKGGQATPRTDAMPGVH